MSAELVRRRSIDHRQCAHGRILAEKRALRSLDELRALDIKQGLVERAVVAEEDAIDVHADRAVENHVAGLRTDAAEGKADYSREGDRHALTDQNP